MGARLHSERNYAVVTDMPSIQEKQRKRWEELTELLNRYDRGGAESLSSAEIKRLCRLYRHATIDLSRARARADDPDLVRYLNQLCARAHGHVYRARKVSLRPLASFLASGFPRLV